MHDPGIGFVTLTRVQMTPDLQLARVYYTTIGTTGSIDDLDKARRNTARALERATPFLRRRIGSTLRLRRTPELEFHYDESIAGQDRIERLLNELHAAEGSPRPDDDNESGS